MQPVTQFCRELEEKYRAADTEFLVDRTGYLATIAGTDLSSGFDCRGGVYIVGTVGTRSEATN